MSHYPVAVITEDKPSDFIIGLALSPFEESCSSPETNGFFEWQDTTDEELERYNTGTAEFVLDTNGELHEPYEKQFAREDQETGRTKYDNFPDGWKLVTKKYTDIYPDFETFIENEGYYEHNEDGKTGYWANPNAKWDWWVIGGRWDGSLKLNTVNSEANNANEFEYVNSAKICDINTSCDEDAYENALAEWKKWENGDENSSLNFYKRDYLVKRYHDAEGYAKMASSFWFRACLTPDGEWHELGEMGWFGVGDEAPEDTMDWSQKFEERFVAPYKDCYMTIVDCHI